jgi:hypothetical protein
MTDGPNPPRGPVFPPWFDRFVKVAGALVAGGGVYVVFLYATIASPTTQQVGYMPKQPVAYSHRVHVGELGMDCRYCHTTVETAAFAAIPPTQVCMNCHTMVRKDSEKMAPVRESYATGQPLRWRRVHDLPDYAYFSHQAHVTRGVGCVSCHGRVDRMEEVWQEKPLNMGFCLDCHRNPEPHLRPREAVTVMDWVPDEDPETLGARLRKEMDVNPSTDCSTCHR